MKWMEKVILSHRGKLNVLWTSISWVHWRFVESWTVPVKSLSELACINGFPTFRDDRQKPIQSDYYNPMWNEGEMPDRSHCQRL